MRKNCHHSNLVEQPRGCCGQEPWKPRVCLCSLRKTKGKKDPAFALNGSRGGKNRSEEETDGPILYVKAEREDVTWESPQNKPSVRRRAVLLLVEQGSQNSAAAKVLCWVGGRTAFHYCLPFTGDFEVTGSACKNLILFRFSFFFCFFFSPSDADKLRFL